MYPAPWSYTWALLGSSVWMGLPPPAAPWGGLSRGTPPLERCQALPSEGASRPSA
ncbi:proline-rich protein 23E [Mustela nigripes]|uniref:proline-rich protein 23E n=1 Tax=Mustela lutreola TaxID=9666 RepID=UPI002797464C|nr:proline-rich protein 23E [Mustela lutreola]XP_059248575.1 proline-rich protein 23E [Mustela nigripes]